MVKLVSGLQEGVVLNGDAVACGHVVFGIEVVVVIGVGGTNCYEIVDTFDASDPARLAVLQGEKFCRTGPVRPVVDEPGIR